MIAKRNRDGASEANSLKIAVEDVGWPPLVAVVTPVYNGEAYLQATMESVQNQTYSNIVHVVLDNCSSDHTPSIIKSFFGARVKVISARNPNVVPIHENWNAVLRLVPAEAAYVKMLCADDLMRRDCISRFVAIAESDPEIEVVFSQDVFYDAVRRANLASNHSVFDGAEVARASLNESINWLPYHHFFIRFGQEDRAMPTFEPRSLLFDYVAVLNRLYRGKLGYVHEPLVYSRWHRESETSKHIRTREAGPLLARFEIFITFGRRFWGEAAYREEFKRLKDRLARFVLYRSVIGERTVAKNLRRGLIDRGVALGPADYFASVLRWPAYARWKRNWRQPKGPKMNESTFLAQ